MSKFCIRCGSEMPDDAQVCTSCGNSFTSNQNINYVPQGNAVVKPKKKHGCLIAIGVVIGIGLLGALFGGDDDDDKVKTSPADKSATSVTAEDKTLPANESTEETSSEEKGTLEKIKDNLDTVSGIKEDIDTIIEIKDDLDDLIPDKKDKNKKEDKNVEYIKATVNELEDELSSNPLRAQKNYKDKYIELTGEFYSADSDGEYFSLGEMDVAFSFNTIHCTLNGDEQLDKLLEYNTGDVITIKCKITDVGELLGYYADVIEIE